MAFGEDRSTSRMQLGVEARKDDEIPNQKDKARETETRKKRDGTVGKAIDRKRRKRPDRKKCKRRQMREPTSQEEAEMNQQEQSEAIEPEKIAKMAAEIQQLYEEGRGTSIQQEVTEVIEDTLSKKEVQKCSRRDSTRVACTSTEQEKDDKSVQSPQLSLFAPLIIVEDRHSSAVAEDHHNSDVAEDRHSCDVAATISYDDDDDDDDDERVDSGDEYVPSRSTNDGSSEHEASHQQILNSLIGSVSSSENGDQQKNERSPNLACATAIPKEAAAKKPMMTRFEKLANVKGRPNAGIPRQRTGKRPKRRCPVVGCESQVADLKEHLFLTTCHADMDLQLRNQLLMQAKQDRKLSKIGGQEPGKKKERDRYFCLCPLCDQYKANLATHLSGTHKMADRRQIRSCVQDAARVKRGSAELGPRVEPGSVLTRMVTAFKIHLRSPAGKGFSEVHSNSMGRRLAQVCQALAGEQKEFVLTDLRRIMDLGKTEGIVDQWLDSEKYKAGSINNFIVALKHLLTFARLHKAYRYGWVSNDCGLDEYSAHLDGISASLSKVRRKQHISAEDDSGRDTIDKEAWAGYKSSKTWLGIVHHMNKLANDSRFVVPHANYCMIRDHIVLRLFLDNYRRAGDLANFRLEEFQGAKALGDDFVTTIKKHKTDGYYAAPLVMKADVYLVVKIFIERVRSSVNPEPEEDTVFLSSSGREANASDINKYLKTAWNDYGADLGRDIGDITATRVRRSAVTVCRQAPTTHDQQQKLSSAMCHRMETADRIYNRSGQKEVGYVSNQVVSEALEHVIMRKQQTQRRRRTPSPSPSPSPSDEDYIPATPPRETGKGARRRMLVQEEPKRQWSRDLSEEEFETLYKACNPLVTELVMNYKSPVTKADVQKQLNRDAELSRELKQSERAQAIHNLLSTWGVVKLTNIIRYRVKKYRIEKGYVKPPPKTIRRKVLPKKRAPPAAAAGSQRELEAQEAAAAVPTPEMSQSEGEGED